ncbi:MAG: ABC transporter permease subunit [Candidatus Omnitrophica bacterium]|nr:ABC transporter permease subunit [Candidatus Omnitrophota bacterium]
MRLGAVWLLSLKETRDARRNRWFIVVSALFALLSVSLSLLGLAGLGSLGISGFGRTAASLLNLVLLIVPLMGLLLGAMSIAGEREQGTLITLLAQPVTVGEVFIGKYLGAASALVSTILLGFGASAVVIARYAGAQEIGDYLRLIAFTTLLGLSYLSLGFLLSVFTRRQATAVGAALFLWFTFIFLSDLGLMGTAIVLRLSPNELFWAVLINPAQSFKLAVIGALQKSLESFGPAGLYASELFGPWLAVVLGGILCVWILAPLGAALVFFGRRCAD